MVNRPRGAAKGRPMGGARILVVDDEGTTRDVLSRILTSAGYDVHDTFNAEEALALLHREPFDLVTLDVMMPHVDGFECCRRIREFTNIPVIFVTARNDALNEVEGFQVGADDYIRKPFHVETVLQRVRAVLRRTAERRAGGAGESPHLGPLHLDLAAREAYIRGRAAGLTTKEFELLRLLVEQCGQIVGREQLAEEVWGQELEPESKTLRVHVYRLRKKLETVGGIGDYILTKRDRGYMLSPELRQVE